MTTKPEQTHDAAYRQLAEQMGPDSGLMNECPNIICNQGKAAVHWVVTKEDIAANSTPPPDEFGPCRFCYGAGVVLPPPAERMGRLVRATKDLAGTAVLHLSWKIYPTRDETPDNWFVFLMSQDRSIRDDVEGASPDSPEHALTQALLAATTKPEQTHDAAYRLLAEQMGPDSGLMNGCRNVYPAPRHDVRCPLCHGTLLELPPPAERMGRLLRAAGTACFFCLEDFPPHALIQALLAATKPEVKE